MAAATTRKAAPGLARLMLHTRLRRAGAGWLRWLPTVQTPRRGRVIVFDATMLHRAHRVRSGRKVALNVWFE